MTRSHNGGLWASWGLNEALAALTGPRTEDQGVITVEPGVNIKVPVALAQILTLHLMAQDWSEMQTTPRLFGKDRGATFTLRRQRSP
ncbi:hypothetical protein NDU88_003783 [Pleurodeles waltl]|uniref:Uncharacterized protein n=1 Tax=Pleurodeles waltl TaxID=8319 RepID=A0AAV7PD29_PLEWA|nr:hypothetical protein NDU88_003783 [Pleurodeles waltl]